MRAITLIRAVAWIGVVATGWSMNLAWGDAPGPGPWQRHVAGAMALCAVTAFVLSIAGRKEQPPSWLARGIALGSAALAVGLAMWLRYAASTSPVLERLVEGDGWTWMIAGTGMTLVAAIAALFLRAAQRVNRKSRGRRRAGAR